MKIKIFSGGKTNDKKSQCHKKLRKRTNFPVCFDKKGKVLAKKRTNFSGILRQECPEKKDVISSYLENDHASYDKSMLKS